MNNNNKDLIDFTSIKLDEKFAEKLIDSLISGVKREYPNVLDSLNIIPSHYHPIFYGCYDWHSSVHSHWSLIKLLKLFPNLSKSDKIREYITNQFTSKNLRKELESCKLYSNSWEIPYGISWFLFLTAEIQTWKDIIARDIYDAINESKIEQEFTNKIINWIIEIKYPICSGKHDDTAFSLNLLLKYCKLKKQVDTGALYLYELIIEKSKFLYEKMEFLNNDKAILSNLNTENSYFPFLSAELGIIDLMIDIFDKEKVMEWFGERYFNLYDQLAKEPLDGNPDDIKKCHLIGLNLARSWSYSNLFELTYDDKFKILANKHIAKSVPLIGSGFWMGDHWTNTFLIIALISYQNSLGTN